MTICDTMRVIDTDIDLFFSQPFCAILNLSRYEPIGDRRVQTNSRCIDTRDKYLLTYIVYPADKSKVNASSRNLWKKKNISSPNSPHWREHKRQNRGWTLLFSFQFLPLGGGALPRCQMANASILFSIPPLSSSFSFLLVFERVWRTGLVGSSSDGRWRDRNDWTCQCLAWLTPAWL